MIWHILLWRLSIASGRQSPRFCYEASNDGPRVCSFNWYFFTRNDSIGGVDAVGGLELSGALTGIAIAKAGRTSPWFLVRKEAKGRARKIESSAGLRAQPRACDRSVGRCNYNEVHGKSLIDPWWGCDVAACNILTERRHICSLN